MSLKKISPSSNVLNQSCLSRATTILNEKIRHHRLSAKEIHFSRDSASNKPIHIDDGELSKIIKKHRDDNNDAKVKSKSSSKRIATSANASPGQLVFIKSEGDKRRRRDIYLVLETNMDKDSITICKVRDVLSNQSASIVPHLNRYRYTVKQTEVILAPNQPKVDKFDMVEVEEDWEWEEDNQRKTPPTKNLPGHHDDEEDDTEDELEDLWLPTITPQQTVRNHPDLQEFNQQNQDLNDREEAIHTDDENQDEMEMPEPDREDDLNDTAYDADEEIVRSEEERHSEEEHSHPGSENEEGPANQNEQEVVVDQSRQPVTGDIVAYVEGNFWVKARIRGKVPGYPHYYNVDLEDGRRDGLYFKPPTANIVESWTLLDPEEFDQPGREQLLDAMPDIPSKQVTPRTTPEQDRLTDDPSEQDHHPYQEELSLALQPEQQLQEGRVHVLPILQPWQIVHNPLALYCPSEHNHRLVIQWPEGTDPEYARKVEAAAASASYTQSQEHLRIPLAMARVQSEMYRKNNSVLAKLKRTFQRKK